MSDDELRGRTPEERRNEIRRRLGAPSDEVLREPAVRPNDPRSGDNRLTVRELLNRMNAAGSPDADTPPPAGAPGPQSAADQPARRPRRFRPADAPTETILGATGRPPADEPNTEVIPATPRGPDQPDASADDVEVTRYIAPVDTDNNPDLSGTATARRASSESQGQVPPGPFADDDNPTTRVPRTVAPVATGGGRRHAAPRSQRDRLHLIRTATITGRVVIAVACVMALLGTGVVWGYQKVKDGNWNTVDAVNSDSEKIRDKQLQTGDETYLIVGTDTRSGENGKMGAGGAELFEGAARSDTVLLVNIPADRSRVVAVSFPRDLQVNRPECVGWNNDAGAYTTDVLPPADGVKLNSVYGEGGPKCMVETLTDISGLNINHFIAMDFYGFEKVVDKIGGVEVCSTVPLNDYELGPILTKAGKQTLRGGKALDYVRARNIETEGTGDYGRIKRQQLFMSSLLRASLSSKVLANPATLNGIIDTFIKYSFVDQVNTDDLLQLAQSMQGLDAGRVTFLTAPTSGTAEDGSGNEIPRDDDIRAIFDAIINDEPLPGEKQEAPSTTSSKTTTKPTTSAAPKPSVTTVNAVSPYAVSLRILNGTGTTGVASGISESLAAQGYQVNGVADASENRTDTVVRYGAGQQAAAATVAQMFPGATIQSDPNLEAGIEVIVGSSFTGELGEAPYEGAQISADELAREADGGELPNDLTVTNAGDTSCS
ncbi:LCP family protein [Gordonia rubripertincta]|uniref:LCP family protein n=1 Tax=Gordonia rubripertincta TaxID=36822 RepID=A0ABT4N1R0_GORRU|nr:LCP family protein [Gordonia rubripertincta]MCZ4553191.1 LCP family protein [Gordonia rubripertincta]